MADDWFCRIDGSVHGPLTARALKAWAEAGRLRATDAVRRTATGKWVAASAVKGLSFAPPRPPAAPPPSRSPSPPVAPGPGAACPSCRAAMRPEAVICVECGYDARAGRRHV